MRVVVAVVWVWVFAFSIAGFAEDYDYDEDDSTSSGNEFFQGFELGAGLDLPNQLAIRADISLPNNFFAVLGLGYKLDFVGGMANGFTDTFGFTDDATSDVLQESLANSIVVDIRAGYEFSQWDGFYVTGGYMLWSGGSGEVDRVDLEDAVDTFYNFWADQTPTVETSAHCLTAHAGYRWSAWDPIIVYAEVGLIKPFSSSSSVNWDNFHFNQDQDEDEIVDYLDGELAGSYVLPTLGIWASYAF